jgi:hypothetical protein
VKHVSLFLLVVFSLEMGETTKSSTTQMSTLEPLCPDQTPDVSGMNENSTLEEKLLPLIELLATNDEEWKSTTFISAFVIQLC